MAANVKVTIDDWSYRSERNGLLTPPCTPHRIRCNTAPSSPRLGPVYGGVGAHGQFSPRCYRRNYYGSTSSLNSSCMLFMSNIFSIDTFICLF